MENIKKVRIVCEKCGQDLQVNEEIERLTQEDDGSWSFDLSGMMCGCADDDEEGSSGEYWGAKVETYPTYPLYLDLDDPDTAVLVEKLEMALLLIVQSTNTDPNVFAAAAVHAAKEAGNSFRTGYLVIKEMVR